MIENHYVYSLCPTDWCRSWRESKRNAKNFFIFLAEGASQVLRLFDFLGDVKKLIILIKKNMKIPRQMEQLANSHKQISIPTLCKC